MNITENNFVLTEELKALVLDRKEIKEKKMQCIVSQKYEEAAKLRDMEKQNIEKIFNCLKSQGGFDISENRQITNDVLLIIDNIEPDDTDFSNAVKRLSVENVERMKLIKSIMRYNREEITLDMLHKAIDQSFQNIKNDMKNKIKHL